MHNKQLNFVIRSYVFSEFLQSITRTIQLAKFNIKISMKPGADENITISSTLDVSNLQ